MMKRLMAVLLLTLAALASANPALAQPVKLSVLMMERARFDRQNVIVAGSVTFAAAPGGASQRFTIMADGMTVDVVATGAFPVRPGLRVEVEGIYRNSSNLIEAIRVTPR
jgi:hypothetical protein